VSPTNSNTGTTQHCNHPDLQPLPYVHARSVDERDLGRGQSCQRPFPGCSNTETYRCWGLVWTPIRRYSGDQNPEVGRGRRGTRAAEVLTCHAYRDELQAGECDLGHDGRDSRQTSGAVISRDRRISVLAIVVAFDHWPSRMSGAPVHPLLAQHCDECGIEVTLGGSCTENLRLRRYRWGGSSTQRACGPS